MSKSYSELIKLGDYMDRFNYLKLDGLVGRATFGYDRYLNQKFYTSYEWKCFRRDIIVRDNGCDLGIDDGLHDIRGKIIIHHINPINKEDLINKNISAILNPDNVICVSHKTHEAIHYGDELLLGQYIERHPGDTKPW